MRRSPVRQRRVIAALVNHVLGQRRYVKNLEWLFTGTLKPVLEPVRNQHAVHRTKIGHKNIAFAKKAGPSPKDHPESIISGVGMQVGFTALFQNCNAAT